MTRKGRPRRPSEDDLAVWRRVTETTTPLPGRDVPVVPDSASPAPVPAPKRRASAPPPPRAETALPQSTPKMDAKAYRKLVRGKLIPDARIDLHGMTLTEAHSALTGFVLSSQAAGHRLVLVITGKGKPRDETFPIPGASGLIRTQVPHWLRAAPLARAVLDIVEAHRRHGGSGAYYVYLRRLR